MPPGPTPGGAPSAERQGHFEKGVDTQADLDCSTIVENRKDSS
jgi:hypothetical protein